MALVIYELQLDMFLVMPHNLTGAEVIDTLCEEERTLVVWTKGRELAEVVVETNAQVLELQFPVDIQFWLYLCRKDMLLYILLETPFELWHMLHLHGETGSVGVTAEVLQQVAT